MPRHYVMVAAMSTLGRACCGNHAQVVAVAGGLWCASGQGYADPVAALVRMGCVCPRVPKNVPGGTRSPLTPHCRLRHNRQENQGGGLLMAIRAVVFDIGGVLEITKD